MNQKGNRQTRRGKPVRQNRAGWRKVRDEAGKKTRTWEEVR